MDFKPEDVVLTHGIQWKQRYVDKDWRIRVAQWNFESEVWSPYNRMAGKKRIGVKNAVLPRGGALIRKGSPGTNSAWDARSLPRTREQSYRRKTGRQIQDIVNPASLPSGRSDVCGQCPYPGQITDKKMGLSCGIKRWGLPRPPEFRNCGKGRQVCVVAAAGT